MYKLIFTINYLGWIVSNNFDENLFSTCNGFTLFGGINAFARYTIISKQFSLPPHYGVRVTFEFWKIDSWNYDEIIYAIVDDKVFSKHYLWFEGSQMCGIGNDWNELKEQITFILDHNSESLIFVITSNLDQDPVDESWGIRNFVLSILRCPQNCLYCLDNDYSNCYFWIGLLQQWHQSINLDGWMKNDNIQPAIQKCVSFDLVQLAPNDRLEKTIENLTPHYKMQINVQAWQIDSWNNETFSLGIDDKLYNQTLFETSGIYSLCGNNGLELIFNIGISLFHSQSQCQISMSTNHNTKTTNASLGIRAINIYLAKCFTGCAQCIGPQKTDCTVCQSGWVFYNNLCSHLNHQSLQNSPSYAFFYNINQLNSRFTEIRKDSDGNPFIRS